MTRRQQKLMTMAPSRFASLGLLCVLAIAGGLLLVKNKPISDIIGAVENMTTSRNLQETDCAKDGTCDASDTLYKDTASVKDKGEAASKNKEDKDDGGDDSPKPEKAASGDSEKPAKKNDPDCVDNHESCDLWASKGECEANPKYMLKQCKKSCFICGEV